MTKRKNNSGGSWTSCDGDIERLLYIKDNRFIANYLDVTVERVSKVRKLADRERNPNRFLDSRSEPAHVDGTDAHRVARNEAENASARLLTAIERTGQKLAPELPKRRLTFDEQLALVASGKRGIVDLGAA